MKLVNLSRGGALIEVAARFPMRSRVRLKLTQATGEVTIAEGRVAWAKVAAIVDRQVNYLVAVIFEEPLAESLVPEAASPGQDSPPAIERGPTESNVEPEPTERDDEDLKSIILQARDNLTQFPSAGSRSPESSPIQEASREPVEWSRPIVLDTLADDLRSQLSAASADVAALSSDKQALETRLAEADEQRTALRAELEAAQRRFDEERSRIEQASAADLAALSSASQLMETRLAEADEQRTALRAELETAHRRFDEQRSRIEQEAAAAVVRADTLQAALKTHEQEQAQALAEQQERYEGLIAELLQTANDQQVEYQQILDERTAARDEQAARAERHEAELARQRAEWEGHRAELEARLGALAARLDAAEALCAAHDERARGLRTEAEKLLSLIASPLPGSSRQDEAAPTQRPADGSAQAVA